MKHIRKQATPRELINWVNGQPVDDNRQRMNCRYADMPADVKQAVKSSLLIEQGFLCCYTGISISDDKSHIEHFKPQTLCVDGEDIAYDNLLAAYPGANFGTQCSFGAHAKAGHFHDGLINPLNERCEHHFRFSLRGEIRGSSEAAQQTIEALHLDDSRLIELRRDAIKSTLYRKRGRKPLSNHQLETIAANYCALSGNRFRSFCFVIAQTAQELLEKRQRERARQEHARRGRRR